MVVAIAVGRSGIDSLLVASQVVLSIVLPFIVFPLVYCTSSKAIMSVRRPRETSDIASATPQELEGACADDMVDFSSGKISTTIGVSICLLVMTANVYVIVSLARGTE